jgi:hypothetical protein
MTTGNHHTHHVRTYPIIFDLGYYYQNNVNNRSSILLSNNDVDNISSSSLFKLSKIKHHPIQEQKQSLKK